MNLGKKILKIRKDNKMSQEEFAEVLNVTRQTVSNWENSKNYPDIETLILINDKFNISLDILLKGDKEMVKDIDSKIRKNRALKFTVITLLIIISVPFFLIMLFHNQMIDYISDEDITNKSGVLIGCTYEDEFIDYHIIYNERDKYPNSNGATYCVGKSKEIRNVTKKINAMKTSKFNNINEFTEYVTKLYEEVGASCQTVHYKNSNDYVEKAEKMQIEFYDSLDLF